MIIGRLTAQAGKSRLRFNSEYQHRCEGTPLTTDGPGCHTRGADWIGLGNNTAPTQMSPEATSTAARGTSTCRSTSTRARGRWRRPTSCCSKRASSLFRYQPIFGHPPPDGITNLIPVTEQSNAINPATASLRAGRELPLPRRRVVGPGIGQEQRHRRVDGLRHGRPQLKIRLPVAPSGPAGRRPGQPDAARVPLEPGVPNAVSYYLPEMGRRTITYNTGLYPQDTWTRTASRCRARCAMTA